MGTHRLTALKHRHRQFDRQLTAELRHCQPDAAAMQFFKTQKLRIKDLIADIEARPGLTAPKGEVRWDRDETERRASA